MKQNFIKKVCEGVIRDLKKIHETQMGFVNEEDMEELEETTAFSAPTGDGFSAGYTAPAFGADKETACRKNILTKQMPKITENDMFDEEYVKENIIRPIVKSHLNSILK